MGKKNKNLGDTSVDDASIFGEDESDSEAAAPGLLDELKPEGESAEVQEGDEAKKPEGEPEESIPGEATDSSTDDHGAPVAEPEAATAPAAEVEANQEGDKADSELAPKSTDEKAEHAPSAHTPAELEPSQNETVNVEPAVEAKEDRANALSQADGHADEQSEEKPDEIPSFSALHDDVSELAEHLGVKVLDEMRKAGDALTPAVSKLHGIEKELHKLGDEARARFTFAKAKAVEAMGALERLFKRG